MIVGTVPLLDWPTKMYGGPMPAARSNAAVSPCPRGSIMDLALVQFARSGAEQGPETFLLEMTVIRERLGQPFPAHRLHGDAIGEAVALIGTLRVEIEPGQKGGSALGDDMTTGLARSPRTLAATSRRIGSGAPEKNVRYSANTSFGRDQAGGRAFSGKL